MSKRKKKGIKVCTDIDDVEHPVRAMAADIISACENSGGGFIDGIPYFELEDWITSLIADREKKILPKGIYEKHYSQVE